MAICTEALSLINAFYDEREAANALRRELDEAREELTDWIEGAKRAADEPCRTDEKHCTCVGPLRELARQRQEGWDRALELLGAAIIERDGERGREERLRKALQSLVEGASAHLHAETCPTCGDRIRAAKVILSEYGAGKKRPIVQPARCRHDYSAIDGHEPELCNRCGEERHRNVIDLADEVAQMEVDRDRE